MPIIVTLIPLDAERDRISAVADHGSGIDVLIDAPPGTTVADVLPLFPTSDLTSVQLVDRNGPVPLDRSIGAAGLRSGAVLGVRPRTMRGPAALAVSTRTSPSLNASAWRLRIATGPDAGRSRVLDGRLLRVGRGDDCELPLTDGSVSRRHLSLRLEAETVLVRDDGSANGSWLLGVTTEETVRLGPDWQPVGLGRRIRVGASVLVIDSGADQPRAVADEHAAVVPFHRSPRVIETHSPALVRFPAEPRPAPRHRGRWIAALIPMVAAVGMAAVLRNWQFLFLGLLSPLALAGSAMSDRRVGRSVRRSERHRREREEQVAAEQSAGALESESRERLQRHPDPGEIAAMVAGLTTRLWERDRSDPLALTVRLGLADQPAETRIERGTEPGPTPMLVALPVVAELAGRSVGIVGPDPVRTQIATWVMAQLLALHAPSDLTVVALIDEGDDTWRWLRWLGPRAIIARTPAAGRVQVGRLVELIEQRRARAPTTEPARESEPWTVVILDPVDRAGVIPAIGTCSATVPSSAS